MARKRPEEIGQSQRFVLVQGLRQVEGMWALVDGRGGLRLFAELSADPDRPEVRPREAYQALLASMYPGWTVRLLQLFWPDPDPRRAFQGQVEGWQGVQNEGTALLRDSLLLFVQESPLPFVRRTILEFALLGNQGECLAWWAGIAGALQEYGLRVKMLSGEEIQALARGVFNPSVES